MFNTHTLKRESSFSLITSYENNFLFLEHYNTLIRFYAYEIFKVLRVINTILEEQICCPFVVKINRVGSSIIFVSIWY